MWNLVLMKRKSLLLKREMKERTDIGSYVARGTSIIVQSDDHWKKEKMALATVILYKGNSFWRKK